MAGKADTPMMKHFFSVKAQYPEAILLYRVGDFFETYGEDAIVASKVLGIVLTKRSSGDALPMAGFPYHAMDVYLPKLVRAGYKVAVCDQIEDPKLSVNKLVKREVTELVTPGVAFSEQMLEQKEHNYLVGLFYDKNQCGAAFLDVSTGLFQIAQGSIQYISTLLNSLKPKELVVSKEQKKFFIDQLGDSWYLSTLYEWAFVPEAAKIKLLKQLNTESLKGYAIEPYPLGICAAGALLVYLEQTQHTGLKNICSISRIDENTFVWLDKFTIRNLEIFPSANSTDAVSLLSVIDKCVSPMGARLLRTYLAMPLLNINEMEARYDVVGYFLNNPHKIEELQSILNSVGDVERITSRAATGKISPKEVLQLSKALALIPNIKNCCNSASIPALTDIINQFVDCSSLLNSITSILCPNAANVIGKGDVIASGVDPILDELRQIAHGGREYLTKLQEQESTKTGITSLKIGYNNVFGYYLEVRNTHKNLVPADWIRKQTLVNAERYITQELKDYEEKILRAEDKIYEIESRLYNSLVLNIQTDIAKIQQNAKVIAKIDVLVGFAQLAYENNYCRPVMNDGYVIDIKQGRHPVIETLMETGQEYVANDIYLDNVKQQIIILTGPNMAGKSAILRQTALIVLLAQIGSYVPAKQANIGYVDKIFTRVGAADNISRGESTFMIEMLETSMILHNLSARSLVLLDEIGRGTSTYDGMSIAKGIVEYIYNYGMGAKTLFATHYHELNALQDNFKKIKNYHIQVKEVGKQIIFLRKLLPGGAEHSFGIHVARMAGMPIQVLNIAEKYLKEQEASHNKTNKNSKQEAVQLTLFQLDDPMLSSIRDRVKNVDINNITPLAAFDLIRKLKEELGV